MVSLQESTVMTKVLQSSPLFISLFKKMESHLSNHPLDSLTCSQLPVQSLAEPSFSSFENFLAYHLSSESYGPISRYELGCVLQEVSPYEDVAILYATISLVLHRLKENSFTSLQLKQVVTEMKSFLSISNGCKKVNGFYEDDTIPPVSNFSDEMTILLKAMKSTFASVNQLLRAFELFGFDKQKLGKEFVFYLDGNEIIKVYRPFCIYFVHCRLASVFLSAVWGKRKRSRSGRL
jgi:hypothetical protein